MPTTSANLEYFFHDLIYDHCEHAWVLRKDSGIG